jgi:hypothetical protein
MEATALALPIDRQTAIEHKYYIKQINQRLRDEIEEEEELIQKGVVLLQEWLAETYYDSKERRLAVVRDMDLERLVIEVLVVTAYATMPELYTCSSARLANHLDFSDKADSIRTMAEIMAILSDTGAYELFKTEDNRIYLQTNFTPSEQFCKFANQVGFLPPMVVEPQKLTRNFQSGYETFNESVILGSGNHHEGNQCLDTINGRNSVPMCLNLEFIKVKEEPKKELETIDQVDQFNEFVKQSKEIYALLVAQGNKFYFTHNLDCRGRKYAKGYHVNPQGSSYKKASLDLAEKEKVSLPQFCVNAGKYENNEKNYKFCSEPMSYERAMKLMEECKSYPFVELGLVPNKEYED